MERTDREAYVRAAGQSGDAAADTCAEIQSIALRDECTSFVAAEFSRQGNLERATALCEAMDDSFWHDECWFRAVEEQGSYDLALLSLCEKAGRFSTSCVDHQFHLRVQTDPSLPDEVGQEEMLKAAIVGLVADYFPAVEPKVSLERVDRGVAMRVMLRWGDGPFDVRQCGEASEFICSYAYFESMRDELREKGILSEACAGTITVQSLNRLGLRPWVPSSQEMGQRIWKELCSGRWSLFRPVPRER